MLMAHRSEATEKCMFETDERGLNNDIMKRPEEQDWFLQHVYQAFSATY